MNSLAFLYASIARWPLGLAACMVVVSAVVPAQQKAPSGHKPPSASKTPIRAADLAGKTPTQIAKILGKPTAKGKFDDSGGIMTYALSGFSKVDVEYIANSANGKLLHPIYISLFTSGTWQQALTRIGMSATGISQEKKTEDGPRLEGLKGMPKAWYAAWVAKNTGGELILYGPDAP
jgi:hypothetical protein